MTVNKYLTDTKKVAAALVFISLGTLSFVLFTQYGLGLRPCVLCVYQRIPYVVIIALGLLAYGLPKKAPCLIFLAALTLLVEAGIAGFHIGVEQHWWEGTAHCSGKLPGAGASIEELRAAIMSAPITRCDQVTAQFLGVSMATYNFFYSLTLAGLTFTAWRKSNGKKA